MLDAVSREAAIKAIDNVFAVCGNEICTRATCADAIRSLPSIPATATVPLRTREEIADVIKRFLDSPLGTYPVEYCAMLADAILQRGIVRETVPLKGEIEIIKAIRDALPQDAIAGDGGLRLAVAAARAIIANGIAWDPEKAARKFRELHYYPQPGDGPLTDADREDALAILKAGSGVL